MKQEEEEVKEATQENPVTSKPSSLGIKDLVECETKVSAGCPKAGINACGVNYRST